MRNTRVIGSHRRACMRPYRFNACVESLNSSNHSEPGRLQRLRLFSESHKLRVLRRAAAARAVNERTLARRQGAHRSSTSAPLRTATVHVREGQCINEDAEDALILGGVVQHQCALGGAAPARQAWLEGTRRFICAVA